LDCENRNQRKSGGLLVHKSTQHFDLVNWWVSGMAKEVVAAGDAARSFRAGRNCQVSAHRGGAAAIRCGIGANRSSPMAAG